MSSLGSLSAEERRWLQQAIAAQQGGRWSEAESWFRRLAAVRPEVWEVRNELANLWLNQGRAAEAATLWEELITLAPEVALLWCNRGNALQALERRAEAQVAYEQALRLDPNLAAARYNLGLVQLAQGAMADGWDNYEARWDSELRAARRTWAAPLWTGEEAIAGRTVWVHAEQGLGDTLQFCRYLRHLVDAGAEVTCEVQAPLLSLLATSFPSIRFVAKGTSVTPTDWQVPLMSLPRAWLRRGVTWAAAVPYLRGEPAWRDAWRDRLPPKKGRRLALIWSSNVRHQRGHFRSAGAAHFLQALAGTHLDLLGVVKEVHPQDALVARSVTNVGPLLETFADTAAVLEQVDGVMTVDTSVAHLAGALGKPVWLWLAFGADWRWFERRADSPYYPTAQLFRQPAPGDWASVGQAVREAIQTWAR